MQANSIDWQKQEDENGPVLKLVDWGDKLDRTTGCTRVSGIVQNVSDKALSHAAIIFRTYSGEMRIGTVEDSIRFLQPGEKWRFDSSTCGEPSGIFFHGLYYAMPEE